MDKIKILFTGILGAVSVLFDAYHPLLIAVVIMILFDWLTGMIAAKVTGEGLDSACVFRDFFKRLGLLISLAFGVFLDWFVPYALTPLNVTLPVKLPFALIICSYIVVNEGISVCENLYKINPKSIPAFIAKWLKIAQKGLDEGKTVKKSTDNASYSNTPITDNTAPIERDTPIRGGTPTTSSASPIEDNDPTTSSTSPIEDNAPTTDGIAPIENSTPSTDSTAPIANGTPTTGSTSPIADNVILNAEINQTEEGITEKKNDTTE